jgi:ABC-type amino acid transport substrate-binding protein
VGIAVVAVLTLAGSAAWAKGNCPARLRISFPDAPAEPFLQGRGDDFAAPPGLLVDWVRGALRRLGCDSQAELLRLPSRRVRAMIEGGELDLVAAVAQGGPMAAMLVLPRPRGDRGQFDLSLGQVEYALYARRGLLAAQGGVAAPVLPPQARVGVTAGSSAERLALERGWPVEQAPSHESVLQKLLAGRTPLLLMHSYYLDERLRRDAALASQVERFGPPVDRLRLHVGARPAFAQQHPAFVDRFWRELCRQSAEAGGACRLPP